ncbi:uncharacterized protein [Panulirus ornatus]
MENGNLLRFRLYKVLHGPVQQAFVYVYHQTYTQDTDVYTFAIKNGFTGFFSETELAALQLEKRLTYHHLPLLFKILKTCCSPSLANPTSPIWKKSVYTEMDLKLTEAKVENLLVTFIKIYEEICRISTPLSQEDFDAKISDIILWLECLIERAGEFDITGRWREDLERIMNLFNEICTGEQKESSSAEIAEDVKVELQMRYELYHRPELDPVLLWLSNAQDISKKRTRKCTILNPGKNIGVQTLVTKLKINGERVCLIKGEPGSGRSSLATLLALSWAQKDECIRDIGYYQAAIVVSGVAVRKAQEDFVRVILPLCSLTHGSDKIYTWLKEAYVLLVIDDAEEMNKDQMEEVKTLIKVSQNISAVILAIPSLYDILQKDWADILSLKLQLNGYDREEIIVLAEDILCGKSKTADPKCLKKFLTKNMCRLAHVLKYPHTLLQMCEAFIEKPDIYEEVTTVTDILWILTTWKISRALANGPQENNYQSKLFHWLLIAGQKALEAFRENKRLEGQYIMDLETDTSRLFPGTTCKNLMSCVFKQRYYHGANRKGFSSTHNMQQEFLAAWYINHEILKGERLLILTGELQCTYQLALFMGGLVPKMKRGSIGLSELDERRLISALVNHSEDSSENLNFNMDLVTEVKASPRLVEYIVEVSEYPDEWNVNAADIQLIPIETLLLNVAPTRIFLNVEELKPYSELSKVLTFLCRVDIYVWLDSISQFKYGSSSNMDRIIKAFFRDPVMTKVDLVAGCISNKMLHDLVSEPAFNHLVYMKLRVMDLKCLSTLLIINKYLHNLLWLEVKIDFLILEEDINGIPCSSVPLMDVHMQGIKDSSVAKLAVLLGSMHTCYAGIHLENTSLTPEGLFVLLKQLQKKDIRLYSHPESRDKFRRWYYPQLASCDESIKLTDEQAQELLGFDDRIYYSNHFVGSCCYAVAIDAWNLMSYLEEQEDIIQFTYKTENLSFIKRLNGSVDIEAHQENNE